MTPDNTVLDGKMQVSAAETYRERELRRQIAKFLEAWGKYESVQRFVRKYGKLNTIRGYLADLDLYFRWLSSVGVELNPDELVRDNLKSIYESGATAVETKRKHTDLMDRYVNVYLLSQEVGYSSRHRKAAAIKEFYRRNDSDLFGDFSLSDGKAERQKSTPPADDIREVLKALPIQQRAPLVLMWQTGAEPAAALALKWGEVNLEGRYIRLDFTGRKKHKRPYFKIAGRDSINLLKIWREKWLEDIGREAAPDDLIFYGKKHGPMSPGWLNKAFKRTAMRLRKQGLISNGDPDSWHIYALRHSFSTECAHAEVNREVREFWMGHVSAIAWVYQHPELHEEDFVKEYAKVEPYVSLNQSELVVEERVKAQFEARLGNLESQLQEYLLRRIGGVA
jgi:integrase